MLVKGTVCWFNVTKGFGFIEGDDKQAYFVHAENVRKAGIDTLAPSIKVGFKPVKTPKGWAAEELALL